MRGILVLWLYWGLAWRTLIELLRQLMHRRKTPVRLILEGLPAHNRSIVRDYVASMNGRLSLHFLPDYAPDLNPDMLVWSHLKRTGTARRPLHKGEKLRGRIDSELATVRDDPTLPPHSSKLLLKPIFVTAE